MISSTCISVSCKNSALLHAFLDAHSAILATAPLFSVHP